MAIYRGRFDQLPALSGRRAVTLGTFDGVHLGHQAICAEANRIGGSRGFDGSVLVTFGRHPRAVLPGNRPPRLLTAIDERLALLAATSIDEIVVLEFDAKLHHMEYDDFVRDVLRDRLGLAHLTLGHDVHFGHERRGTFASVADLADQEGFTVSQVASIRHAAQPISSTRIRDRIDAGEIDEATAMLGHPYLIRGEVVKGKGEGRKLGFPTANLDLPDPDKLLPPHGVYAAWARAGSDAAWAEAVINLGARPSWNDGGGIQLEVHLLQGTPNLYGMTLDVALGPRIREELRFESVGELAEQIGQDAASAPELLEAIGASARPERLDRL